MTNQTQNAQQATGQKNGYAKRFNFNGVVANLKSGQTGEGKTWLSLKLQRPDNKGSVTVAAFEDKADNFLELMQAKQDSGEQVKLFGYFRPKTFKPADKNESITFQQFMLLWAGEPQPQTAEGSDAQGEQAGEQAPVEAKTEAPAESGEAEQVDPMAAQFQAMTKAQLVDLAAIEYAHDLNPSMKKDDMVTIMVRLANNEMVAEMA